MVESNSVTMLCRFLKAASPLPLNWPIRKISSDITLVEVEGCQHGTSNGYLTRYCPYEIFNVAGLGGIPIAVIPLYQARYRTGLDKQFDLPHESQPSILFRVFRTVVVQLAYTTEFLEDNTEHPRVPLSRGGRDVSVSGTSIQQSP